MACSEPPFDLVVSRIFEKFDLGNGKISISSVMELASTYISSESPEYLVLQNTLMSSCSGDEIGQAELASAFKHWTRTLNSGGDFRFFVDSNSNFSDTSLCSITSQGYRERIEDLQIEMANKEHIVSSLKKDNELLSQHIQVIEQSHNFLVTENIELKEKLQTELSNATSLKNQRIEFDELQDTISTLSAHTSVLKDRIEKLNKENSSLRENVSIFSDEIQKLNERLTQVEIEKAKLTKEVGEAAHSVEWLQEECVELRKKISEHQATIAHLEKIKKSLEEDIINILDETKNIEKSSFVSTSEESLKNEIKKITSTPRNQMSLMAELNIEPVLENCSEIVFSTENFLTPYPMLFTSSDRCSTDGESNSELTSPENSHILHTYNVNEDCQMLKNLEQELSYQSELNRHLRIKLYEQRKVINDLYSCFEGLKINKELYEAACHELIITLREMKIKMKSLQNVITMYNLVDNKLKDIRSLEDSEEVMCPRKKSVFKKYIKVCFSLFKILVLCVCVYRLIMPSLSVSLREAMGIFEIEYIGRPPT